MEENYRISTAQPSLFWFRKEKKFPLPTCKMKSYSLFLEKINQYSRKERCLHRGKLATFFLSCIAATTILSFFIYFPNRCKLPLPRCEIRQNAISFQGHHDHNISNCSLFEGHWTTDLRGPLYTNSSCGTIPTSKNCFRHGRSDRGFLHWRWKPDDCDLPRFEPRAFLDMVRGNKMAFIGDSVARNQMESLLCLLGKVEDPKEIYKDSEDRLRIWHFPEHDFTLMTLWTKFLVAGDHRVINGSKTETYNLHLDKVDQGWSPNIPSIDHAIISVEHWFFRPIYLYQGTNIVGCVYCNEPNITNVGPKGAIQMSLRAALNYINECKECRGIVTFVRTFSPSHFENGTWNTGGNCNRTAPLVEKEINLGGQEWEIRKVQVEETEKARMVGKRDGKSFVVLDVTKAMMMRPDGHPGPHWGNKWMKGYSDCVHWCLPGPIDAWNEFLMAILEKETGLVS